MLAKKNRVFYSFEYNKDFWRAAKIRTYANTNDNSVFPDIAWEEVRIKTNNAIKQWIDEQIKACSCVVVLIGATTATRKWVIYEIDRAYELNKGIFGIYVNKLTDRVGYQTGKGKNPFDLIIANNGEKLSDYVVCYDSPHLSSETVCVDIAEHLEEWVENALKNKAPR